MILHEYESNSGKKLITEYIQSLPTDESVDGFSVLKHLENGEWDIDGENIYLLHACRKQKNRTEKTDKEIVIKRAKEVGKITGKTYI